MAGRKKPRAVGKGKTTTTKRTSKGRASAQASRTASHDAEYNPKPSKNRNKMTSNGVQKPTARRGPGRTSKKDRWGEEFLTTNSKSPIIDVDLVVRPPPPRMPLSLRPQSLQQTQKLLAHPSAWFCLEEDEKKEILDLLPEHVRPQADPDDPDSTIPPPSPEFLRYNNNWRDGVRQFQLDLQQGKYEPQWLNQAAQAMEERADGNFDQWKEEQFEEFWGQKQKMDRSLAAGASSKIKLETLVEHNCIRVGDKWKYARGFGKGSNSSTRLIVEKEVEIIDREGSSLTFAIPSGRNVFLRGSDARSGVPPEPEKVTMSLPVKVSPEPESNLTSAHKESNTNTSRPANASPVGSHVQDEDDVPEDDAVVLVPSGATQESTNGSSPPRTDETAPGPDPPVSNDAGVVDAPDGTQATEGTKDRNIAPGSVSVVENEGSKVYGKESPDNDRVEAVTAPKKDAMDVDSQENKPQGETDGSEPSAASGAKPIDSTVDEKQFADAETSSQQAQSPTAASTVRANQGDESMEWENILVKNITSPQGLESRILSIDGRVSSPPNGNAWKEFRCFRNNQDIGSLWEIRQEWFSRQTR